MRASIRHFAAALALALLAPAIAAAQTVTGYEPSDCGTPGHPVSIVGTGFSAPLTVTFTDAAGTGSVPAQAFRFSATRIETRIPAGAGTGPITVNGAAGPTFNVLGAGSPVIWRVAPATVVQGGHFGVVGYDLDLGPTGSIALGTNILTQTPGGGRFLAALVPATLAPGTYNINIINGLGLTNAPCVTQITVVPPGAASLTSVTPDNGTRWTPIRFDGTYLGPLGRHLVDWALTSAPTAVLHTVPADSNGFDHAFSFVPFGATAGVYTVTFHTPQGDPTVAFTVNAPVR